jgi:hypothetical protein
MDGIVVRLGAYVADLEGMDGAQFRMVRPYATFNNLDPTEQR